MRFKDAIYNLNNNVSQPGIYAIPSELSMNSPQVSMETRIPYMDPISAGICIKNWDIPKSIRWRICSLF